VRVLVTLLPSLSHVHTAMPLALELRRRGHDVRIATSSALTSDIEAWGVPCYLVGRNWDAAHVETNFPGYLRANPGAQIRTLAGLAEQLSAEILGICDLWRPDLVVRDSYDMSGLFAARRCDVPSVVLGIGFRAPMRWLETALQRRLATVAPAWGVELDDVAAAIAGDLWLSHYPPSLAGPRATLPVERHVRPVTFSGSADPDVPSLEPADVYVSLGTVLNKRTDLLRTLIRALDDHGLRVIATTGRDVDPAELGGFSARVQLRRYIPESDVLPHVRSVVSHGGFNTVMPALGLGLPVCCVPLSMDQPLTASRCRSAGAGTVLATGLTNAGLPLADPAAVDTDRVLGAVLPLLDEPSYRDKAARLAVDIGALPDASATADLVESINR
jgi:UDP:flavonoid glycosyltransferase YjiC (YdhE family)